MATVEKVLIVGGGPAGLSAATVLNKRGIQAELAEINEQIRPLGSGLTMTGPTLRALRMVDEDALEECVRQGAGHDGLRFCTADGQVLERVEMPQPAGPITPGASGSCGPSSGGCWRRPRNERARAYAWRRP